MPFSRSLFGALPAKGALAILTAGALALLGCAADVGQEGEGAEGEATADSEDVGTAASPQIRGYGYGPQPCSAHDHDPLCLPPVGGSGPAERLRVSKCVGG